MVGWGGVGGGRERGLPPNKIVNRITGIEHYRRRETTNKTKGQEKQRRLKRVKQREEGERGTKIEGEGMVT